jgi:hypothetical protein
MYSIDAASGAKTLLVQLGEVGSGCSDPDAFITACAAGGMRLVFGGERHG